MKKIIPLIISICISTLLFAQDIRLNDSVIFIDNKPVALYAKFKSNAAPQSDMEIYSFNDYVLIKAEVIKFNAPVPELKPFYYYELSFPPTADTLAVYVEDEAFPLVLANIIKDYDLIKGNELNKKNVAGFIKNYHGGFTFREKVKSFTNYLNDTRYFNEQVVRDRTKPVIIINERVIYQDGLKIGYIAVDRDDKYTTRRIPIAVDTSGRGPGRVIYSEQSYVTPVTQINILMANQRKVEFPKNYSTWVSEKEYRKRNEKSLYDISRSKKAAKGSYTDNLLMNVCYLIENYLL